MAKFGLFGPGNPVVINIFYIRSLDSFFFLKENKNLFDIFLGENMLGGEIVFRK